MCFQCESSTVILYSVLLEVWKIESFCDAFAVSNFNLFRLQPFKRKCRTAEAVKYFSFYVCLISLFLKTEYLIYSYFYSSSELFFCRIVWRAYLQNFGLYKYDLAVLTIRDDLHERFQSPLSAYSDFGW